MQDSTGNQNVNVLIVDDDPDAVANLQSLLSHFGYRTSGFVDPQQAIDEATSCRFDAAVLDYRMPGMNGIELCQELKAIDPQMSVALHSAFLPDDQVDGCTACKAQLLAKPLDLSALITFVENARRSERFAAIDLVTQNDSNVSN